ncbi:MAG: hypothetical protein GTO63_12070, partial [Anaerolineae bacterium]|nr:hypothetical protein [Anaerolineae bacterium]NIN95634.1 hypothetical protein [Anaerolineae bacterium]NIQ78591.1 hypothetical protein [Anaerolineae bacterium]
MQSTPFDIVFCDTCVCGSTVASHLAKARTGLRALFLADYAVNPLGIKSHGEVSEALNRWVDAAVGRAPILIVACNTASVRLQDAPEVVERAEHLGVRLYSMVDLLDALIRAESHRLKNERVCLMGTEYTVSSSFYRDRMKKAGVSVVVPLAAT